jgi:hypothetical protein
MDNALRRMTTAAFDRAANPGARRDVDAPPQAQSRFDQEARLSVGCAAED